MKHRVIVDGSTIHEGNDEDIALIVFGKAMDNLNNFDIVTAVSLGEVHKVITYEGEPENIRMCVDISVTPLNPKPPAKL